MFKFLKDLIYYTTIPSRLIALDLRKKTKRIRTPNELVDLAFNYRPLSFKRLAIRPAQVKEEILKLLRILKGLKPRTILEIGTASGGTLFLFTQVAEPDAIIISIDLPGGPFGGGYPAWKIPLYKSFARYPTQRIYLFRADSHNVNTLRKVKKILGNKLIDFLFIDGDHSYEGVKKDFEMYAPLVRKGGVIALHDIVPDPQELVGGVPKFWRELKNKLGVDRVKELVKDWNQGGYGIGLIIKD